MSAPARALRMHAQAELATELAPDGRGGLHTRLVAQRSQAPLKLRPTLAAAPEPWSHRADDFARVRLAAAAAGPVGGDRLRLDVRVGPGSSLVLTEASATLLLPGHDGAESRLEVHADIGAGATLIWLPEPVIAAQDCRHVNSITVEMAADSRLLLREELVLGRSHEPPGRLRQQVRVRRTGTPLHAQDLDLGADTGPAVLGHHGAVGSLLVVDQQLRATQSRLLDGDGALLPLATGDAVLAQALAADSSSLRARLDQALTLLGPPWDPYAAGHPAGGTAPTHTEESA